MKAAIIFRLVLLYIFFSLCEAKAEETIPSNSYDCFLLPNTLCVLKDIEGALRNALRVLKPGGVILASQQKSAEPSYGQSYELSVIAAVVVVQRVPTRLLATGTDEPSATAG